MAQAEGYKVRDVEGSETFGAARLDIELGETRNFKQLLHMDI